MSAQFAPASQVPFTVPKRVLADAEVYAAAFAEYVAAAPTAYHAVAAAANALEAAGFSYLPENAAWDTASVTGNAYTVRDGALIAWRVGGGVINADSVLRIFGAHTDSPGFVLKPVPTREREGWQQLNVEVYGGPLTTSWLDRDLAIAGKLLTRDGGVRLVHTPPVARIPHLAIHLERDALKGVQVDLQQHLQPILGVAEGDFWRWLAQQAGCSPAEITGWDLRLADAQAPARLGLNRELFASGRLDNLTGVFAGLVGLLCAEVPPGQVALFTASDHEEVGSETYSGASGTFLNDTLTRVFAAVGVTAAESARVRARSWIMSCDAGHGVHPNYPEKHDPVVRPQLGQGMMRKMHANWRYATDAEGTALWQWVCAAAGVTGQVFVSNNAISCGTTIGPLVASGVGMRTLDVGVPLLSMHSVRELAHIADLHSSAQIAAAFYAA